MKKDFANSSVPPLTSGRSFFERFRQYRSESLNCTYKIDSGARITQ